MLLTLLWFVLGGLFLFGCFCVFFDQAVLTRRGTIYRVKTSKKIVALTFDDGPSPIWTPRILDELKKADAKATFFMIGRNAKAEPATARLVLAAGHTIGSHTQNHPLRPMAPARALTEINSGLVAIRQALGDPRAVAPYFRFPGLNHTAHAEQYLRAHWIAAWSIDVDSHDWKRIAPERVVENVLTRLAAKGRGIILLHDVQAKTAHILSSLLAELKHRGYRIVHVVPPPEPPLPAPAVLVAMAEAGAAKEIARLRAAKAVPAAPALRPSIVAMPRPGHTEQPRHTAKTARPGKAMVATPDRRAASYHEAPARIP